MRHNMDVTLYQQGCCMIAGADEAGRGAWAGPLVAAAVIMPNGVFIPGVNDSKMLTPRRRLQLYYQVITQAVCWAVVCVSPAEIDQLGVHQANTFALSYVLTHLEHIPDIALVDGFVIEHYLPIQAVIDGDAKSYTIAAASIIAKVTRDRLMMMVHQQSPEFGFSKHKGYGTVLHQQALQTNGVTIWHRQSFAPVQRLMYNYS